MGGWEAAAASPSGYRELGQRPRRAHLSPPSPASNFEHTGPGRRLGTAVWLGSSHRDGSGGYFRRMGSWAVCFFLRFLIFFHFLNKHEYIYIFFSFIKLLWSGDGVGWRAAWPPSVTRRQSSDSGGSWQPSSRFFHRRSRPGSQGSPESPGPSAVGRWQG